MLDKIKNYKNNMFGYASQLRDLRVVGLMVFFQTLHTRTIKEAE